MGDVMDRLKMFLFGSDHIISVVVDEKLKVKECSNSFIKSFGLKNEVIGEKNNYVLHRCG